MRRPRSLWALAHPKLAVLTGCRPRRLNKTSQQCWAQRLFASIQTDHEHLHAAVRSPFATSSF